MRRLLSPALLGALVLAGVACRKEEKAPPLKSLAPEPLPALPTPVGAAADALHQLEPAEVYGEPLPEGAARWELVEGRVRVGGEVLAVAGPAEAGRLVARLPAGQPVLLVPDADSYLVQVAALLAALDDAGAQVWLAHPGGAVAYRLTLRDEPAFQAWLDEAQPGKVRIVQRGEGFELMTNVGKLLGPDPNGPTVPLRGGRQDIAGLRRGLEALQGRFDTTEDVCWLPSFGMELARVAEALSGDFRAPGEAIFPETCLVYPRPRAAAQKGSGQAAPAAP